MSSWTSGELCCWLQSKSKQYASLLVEVREEKTSGAEFSAYTYIMEAMCVFVLFFACFLRDAILLHVLHSSDTVIESMMDKANNSGKRAIVTAFRKLKRDANSGMFEEGGVVLWRG